MLDFHNGEASWCFEKLLTDTSSKTHFCGLVVVLDSDGFAVEGQTDQNVG